VARFQLEFHVAKLVQVSHLVATKAKVGVRRMPVITALNGVF
jgi:hypothetical protein